MQFENYSNSRQVWPWKSFLQMLWGPNAGADISRCMCLCVLLFICVLAWELQGEPLWMQDFQCHAVSQCCWAEAPIKIARMTLTIKLDGNWSSFQLANSAPPLSVTGSAIAPSARMLSNGRQQAETPTQKLCDGCTMIRGLTTHNGFVW